MTNRFREIWREAADDLSLEIVAPYICSLPSGATIEVECPLFR